jgi:hypothetical protein
VTLDTTLFLVHAAENDIDPSQRAKSLAVAYNFSQLAPSMWQHDDFDWDDCYGVDGATVIAAFDAYERDWRIHHFLNQANSGDWLLAWAAPCIPLAVHWGDMATVGRNFERSMASLSRVLQEDDQDAEIGVLIAAPLVWSTFTWNARLPSEYRTAVANMMSSYRQTWSTAHETLAEMLEKVTWCRTLGDRNLNHCKHRAATVAFSDFLQFVANARTMFWRLIYMHLSTR